MNKQRLAWGIIGVLAIWGSSIGMAADTTTPRYLKLQDYAGAFIALTDAESDNVQQYVDGAWVSFGLETPATDIMVSSDQLYAATPAGLMHYMDDMWMPLETTPCATLAASHGYIVCLGVGEAVRLDEAKLSASMGTATNAHAHMGHSMPMGSDSGATLAQVKALPTSEQGEKFLMLGDHTHALLADGVLYRTPDVGLGYVAFDAPVTPLNIFVDSNFDLFAETTDGLWRYNVAKNTWADAPIALPDDQLLAELFPFNGTLIARTVDGAVYLREAQAWQPVTIGDALIGDLSYQPVALFALAQDGRLFSSQDGQKWIEMES